ncbi:MAG: hypothetical protein GY792_08850, partial [Gammaproteobacteria bacterium]|nr:hypothetical protein [Gammaproteobacteria bacterium]
LYLTSGSASAIITTLLSAIWESRYPVWEDNALLHHIDNLITHLQSETDWSHAALSEMEVACLEVYLTLGLRFAQYFPGDNTWSGKAPLLDEASLAAGIETFLTAVNQHYFPVEEEVWLDEIEFMAGLLQVIDLVPVGYDLNPDYADPDHYPEPVRTLLDMAAAELNTHYSGLAFEDETSDRPVISLDGLSDIIPGMPLPIPIQKGLPTLL